MYGKMGGGVHLKELNLVSVLLAVLYSAIITSNMVVVLNDRGSHKRDYCNYFLFCNRGLEFMNTIYKR